MLTPPSNLWLSADNRSHKLSGSSTGKPTGTVRGVTRCKRESKWSQIVVTEVRLLSAADIPAGMRLKAAAGWNQTEADWQRVLMLEPDGCFAIECDGHVRATATAVCFGEELAWVGMVLTDGQYRGRGFARQLMEHTLAYLRGRRVAWIKLDATDMGRPLYERLGFREEGGIERWIRPAGAWPRQRSTVGRFDLDAALDREAYGADRSCLLQMLAGIESASMVGAGF